MRWKQSIVGEAAAADTSLERPKIDGGGGKERRRRRRRRRNVIFGYEKEGRANVHNSINLTCLQRMKILNELNPSSEISFNLQRDLHFVSETLPKYIRKARDGCEKVRLP